MKNRNISVKDKILIFILPFVIITLLIIAFLVYFQAKHISMSGYNLQKEQIEANIVNALQVIDSGFSMLEKDMEDEMEQRLLEFKSVFERAGGDPDHVSLDSIKSAMGGKYDFVIIDSETRIIKTTIPNTLDFNFMETYKPLGESINRMRSSDSIKHERFSSNPGTGFLTAFAYAPTSDHKYLLEIAYTRNDLAAFVRQLKPYSIASNLAKTNPEVVSLRIFDIYGAEFVNRGSNKKPTEESLAIVERAIKERQFEITKGNITKSYQYVDLKKDYNDLSDNSKIIEIVYDRTPLINELRRISLICFFAGFLVMAVMIFFIIALVKKTTYPLTILSDTAKKVAMGDYGVTAQKLSHDEIGELTDIFNSMTARINEDFTKIETQKTELEKYSKELEEMVDERTSELLQARATIQKEKDAIESILLSMGDAVITTDKEGFVIMMNACAEKLTGWVQEEVEGRYFGDVFPLKQIDPRNKFQNPLETALRTGETQQEQNQLVIVTKGGMEIPIENNASPIREENGHITGAVLVFRDYTEKKERLERIEYLSLHDLLTDIYNRRFFEEELRRLDTARNLPLTIIMLDVNGLKLINDAFGHAIGDLTLQRVAGIIKEVCRGDDIVARFGGDEFVILLPVTSQDAAEQLVKRIYAAFEAEIVDNISISVSCGWATKHAPDQSLSVIFKLAEDHMYRRKLSESKSMHYKTIDTILKTLHGKSERERKHSERVGELCELLAAALNMEPEDVKEFRTIGLMHDIGKIAIDLSILDKPDVLNHEERIEIERHPELGYQILRSINDFAKLAEYTLAHHERWDGTGYPRKLKGEEIPLEARIIAIADAYDSMTSDRAYRKAMDKEAAIEELRNAAGHQFDPELVKVFVGNVLA